MSIDNSLQLYTSNINVDILNESIILPFLTLDVASNVFVTSNVLINAFLPSEQDILTSSSSLLGTGGNITGINYNILHLLLAIKYYIYVYIASLHYNQHLSTCLGLSAAAQVLIIIIIVPYRLLPSGIEPEQAPPDGEQS